MRRMHHVSLIGLLLALAMIAAACSSSSEETTTTTTTTVAAATTTTVAPFDLVASVDEYLSALPEGFQAIGDIQAFKDGVEASGALVIDVRTTAEYEEGHIPGAVNIPLRTLAANVDKIPTDTQVYVYCKSGFRAAQALSSLGMLGYTTNVLSYKPGWNGWTEAGEEESTEAVEATVVGAPDIEPELLAAVDGFLSTIPEGFLSAGDAAAVQEAIDAGAFLLDVRTADEYAKGYLEGATNVDLRSLAKGIDGVPTDVNVVSYCGSGHRAGMSVAALHVLDRANSKGYGGSYDSLVEAAIPVATP
ncbi:MAG: rhodanese-like domain-containing protein [Actinomycetota bacterium]|nr:rhodanese-like domain-containing protein [Actinomycetota bacterium]